MFSGFSNKKVILEVVNYFEFDMPQYQVCMMIEAIIRRTSRLLTEADGEDIFYTVSCSFYEEVCQGKNAAYRDLTGKQGYQLFLKMIKNKANAVRDKKKREETLPSEEVDLKRAFFEKRFQREEIKVKEYVSLIVEKAKNDLNPTQYAILILFLKEKKDRQIAEELGKSEGYIRNAKQTAIQIVKKLALEKGW